MIKQHTLYLRQLLFEKTNYSISVHNVIIVTFNSNNNIIILVCITFRTVQENFHSAVSLLTQYIYFVT